MAYYEDDQVTLHHGDSLEVLRTLAADSVDAVVTDPPYGLEFMGQEWDSFSAPTGGAGFERDGMGKGFTALPNYGGNPNPTCRNCRGMKRGQDRPGFTRCRCDAPDFPNVGLKQSRAFGQWCEQWAAECLRVLKPGGHLLAFGGTRTVHRLTCGIEDAGFEIRDGIDWLYGSGFPKSLNIGAGRGTALKPAREPIVVARKPLAGTVVANADRYGTGVLNIDACRTGSDQRTNHAGGASSLQRVSRVEQGYRSTVTASVGEASTVTGRWPTNVVLSHAGNDVDGDLCVDRCVQGCSVAEMDAQSGVTSSGSRKAGTYGLMGYMGADPAPMPAIAGDSGGASRFFPVFRYEAKAPTSERPKVDGEAQKVLRLRPDLTDHERTFVLAELKKAGVDVV